MIKMEDGTHIALVEDEGSNWVVAFDYLNGEPEKILDLGTVHFEEDGTVKKWLWINEGVEELISEWAVPVVVDPELEELGVRCQFSILADKLSDGPLVCSCCGEPTDTVH